MQEKSDSFDDARIIPTISFEYSLSFVFSVKIIDNGRIRDFKNNSENNKIYTYMILDY
jgi:hypothetical protein